MKTRKALVNLVLAAMFLAMAYVLPAIVTGSIPEIGQKLLPMHIPVLLCGFICGAPWGGVVGFCVPILRSLIFTKPVFYPDAIAMAFELCTYGVMAGLMLRILPRKELFIYPSLIISMLTGRAVWGIVKFLIIGFDYSEFGITAFIAGGFTNAIPGIILQLVLVPPIVMLIKKVEKQFRKTI